MDMNIEQERAAVAISIYGYWSKHPAGYPVEDWQYEIANGDTRQGYWEWCAAKELEAEEES